MKRVVDDWLAASEFAYLLTYILNGRDATRYATLTSCASFQRSTILNPNDGSQVSTRLSKHCMGVQVFILMYVYAKHLVNVSKYYTHFKYTRLLRVDFDILKHRGFVKS